MTSAKPNAITAHAVRCSSSALAGPVEVRRAVAEEQHPELARRGLARGGVHADVGVDPAEDDDVDAARAQDHLQIGAVEAAEAGLADDHVARTDVHDRVQGGGRCVVVDDPVSDWGADLTEQPGVGAVGPQDMPGPDDGDAGLPAGGREPVEPPCHFHAKRRGDG